MKVTIREIEEKDYLQAAAIWRNVPDILTATDSIVAETYEKMKADCKYCKVTKTLPAVRDFL